MMKPKLKNRSITFAFSIYLIILAFAALIITLAIFDESNPSESFFDDSYTKLTSDWTYQNLKTEETSIVKLPIRVKDASPISVFSNTLPETVHPSDILCFKTNHQGVQVYIDEELIYERKALYGSIFPIPANEWHLITLPDDCGGAKIDIYIASASAKNNGLLGDVFVGEKSSISFSIAKDSIPSIISFIALIAIAFFLIIICVVFYRTDLVDQFFLLCLFSIGIITYSIPDIQIAQFFTSRVMGINILSYEAFILLPIPLMFYYSNSSNSDKLLKLTSRVSIYTCYFVFGLLNLLHFLGVIYLQDSINISGLVILMIVLSVGFANFRMIIRNKKRHTSAIGFVALFILIMIDMIRFIANDFIQDSSLYSRIGLEIYIVFLSINILKDTLELSVMGRNAYKYEQLALHDVMTGVMSRSAYEIRIKEINTSADTLSKTIVMVIDLDDLKKYNDEYGHNMGDEYIKDCVSFISNSFKDICDLYRTGGDEFVLICTEHSLFEFECALQDMNTQLKNYNKTSDIPIKFSYGYGKFNPEYDQDLNDLCKRADKAMYQMKFLTKENEKQHIC